MPLLAFVGPGVSQDGGTPSCVLVAIQSAQLGACPHTLSEWRQSAEVAAASTLVSRVLADICPLTDAFKISKCNFFLYNLDTFHIAVSALVPGANENP